MKRIFTYLNCVSATNFMRVLYTIDSYSDFGGYKYDQTNKVRFTLLRTAIDTHHTFVMQFNTYWIPFAGLAAIFAAVLVEHPTFAATTVASDSISFLGPLSNASATPEERRMWLGKVTWKWLMADEIHTNPNSA